MPDGIGHTDIKEAYRLLKFARSGYEKNVENGFNPHAESLEAVKTLLADPIFAEYVEKDLQKEKEKESDDDSEEEDDD
jgi:hypothetical protein